MAKFVQHRVQKFIFCLKNIPFITTSLVHNFVDVMWKQKINVGQYVINGVFLNTPSDAELQHRTSYKQN